MARWLEARWTILRVLLLTMAGITAAPVDVMLSAPPARYSARFSDGERFEGDDLTDWHQSEGEPRLNGRRLLDPANPLRWLVNRSLPLPTVS